jgi:dihydrolipoamide dehydrogenase
MVAEIIAGKKRAWDKVCIPAVCFTDPEIVTAGLTPEDAKVSGIETKTGRISFRTNGRVLTRENEAGFIRVIARADNHLLLGIQAVGADIAELSAAFGLALEMGARLEDIAATVHAHPTLSESLQEAASEALGHAIHI